MKRYLPLLVLLVVACGGDRRDRREPTIVTPDHICESKFGGWECQADYRKECALDRCPDPNDVGDCTFWCGSDQGCSECEGQAPEVCAADLECCMGRAPRTAAEAAGCQP